MDKTTREEVLPLTSDKKKSDKDQDGYSLSRTIALVLAAVRLLIELLS